MSFYTEVVASEAIRFLFLPKWKKEDFKKPENCDCIFYKKIFQQEDEKKEEYIEYDSLPKQKFFAVSFSTEESEIKDQMIKLLFEKKISSFYVQALDCDLYEPWEKIYVTNNDYKKIQKAKKELPSLAPSLSSLKEDLRKKLGTIKDNAELGKDYVFFADIPYPMTWWTKYKEITKENIPNSVTEFITTLAKNCLDLKMETKKRKRISTQKSEEE